MFIMKIIYKKQKIINDVFNYIEIEILDGKNRNDLLFFS